MEKLFNTEVDYSGIDINALFTSTKDYRSYYMNEYAFYDGERFIIFNITEINTVKGELIVAVSIEGSIRQQTFDLMLGSRGYYFEYGVYLTKIFIDDFEQIEEEH